MALYVVVFQVAHPGRRRRVDEALRFAGERIRTGVYEVACSDRTMARLLEEMERALMDGDVARVYPVCRRCQRGAKLHGGPALTELPPAFIIGGDG